VIDTVLYIIRFLLGEDLPEHILSSVGYTADENEFGKYRVVIKPSSFFDRNFYGTSASLPVLPLKIWEETPLLYGEPVVEKHNDTLLLHADLVASVYFLISRYEEWVRKDVRDTHGRFPGKESLPYRSGFIDRPLVEEYGRLLRSLLRDTGLDVPEPPKQIKKIFLTHDVDQLAHYRHIRGLVGGLLRGIKRNKEGQRALRSFFGNLRNDPWYTFPFLYKLDNDLIQKLGKNRCESVTFFRSGGGKRREDKPVSNLSHPDYKSLIRYCKRKNITIGLHTSYQAGINPKLIIDEKDKLDRIIKTNAVYNRNHYLCSREPMDMLNLVDAKITDDFTLGFADIAGFRLGTCRPVKWINLITTEVSALTLHPLAVMDCTLSDKKYMYMNAHDAYQYCEQLINRVKENNGELVLLWHNTMVEKTPELYHRNLYREIIKYLSTES